jgi:hypothetical protein
MQSLHIGAEDCSEAMAEVGHTRKSRLGDFLRELSSDAPQPGSGAAGAIALALAAACAAKAASLSLKYASGNTELRRARDELLVAIDEALRGSDQDAGYFAEYLRWRTNEAAENVIAADRRLLKLVDAVMELLEALDPQVRSDFAGDIVAARALSEAARTIHTENLAGLAER